MLRQKRKSFSIVCSTSGTFRCKNSRPRCGSIWASRSDEYQQGSNALIVRDTESKLAILKQLVDGLDLQVPQVQIEARIVQADTVYARGLGIQWGFRTPTLEQLI